jgi:hypothetical protein
MLKVKSDACLLQRGTRAFYEKVTIGCTCRVSLVSHAKERGPACRSGAQGCIERSKLREERGAARDWGRELESGLQIRVLQLCLVVVDAVT